MKVVSKSFSFLIISQVGAIRSKNRSFQLHPLPEDVVSHSPFLHVLLTWSNETDDKLSSLEDFLEVPEDVLENEDANDMKCM